MLMGQKSYSCDHPECKSTVELSDAKDINESGKALHVRGWEIAICADGSHDVHFCPAHHGDALSLKKE